MSKKSPYQDWIDKNVPKTHLPWYWLLEIPEFAALFLFIVFLILCFVLGAVFG